jgi:hypothetical protein
MSPRFTLFALVAVAAFTPYSVEPALAQSPLVEIAPHRAAYAMSLERASSGSGIVDASGQMLFEWGDSCDGWTMEQRYNLTMRYNEQDESEIAITFVTWESKDGRRYRFNVRKLRDSEPPEDLRGDAVIPALDQPGEAKFSKPAAEIIKLPKGSVFPTAHTILLIESARRQDSFVSRIVFDGGAAEGPFQVTAGIGKEVKGDANAENPVLRARWWPVRMAFFPADSQGASPDYELGMSLQENGVARDMRLDYGTFVLRATLTNLELLPKPVC